MKVWISNVLFLAVASGLSLGSAEQLTLRSEKPAEDALLFSGDWQQGEGYLSRTNLAELPGFTTIRSQIVPGAGEADLGVISLTALVELLGLKEDADGLVLECTDRWESFMEMSFIREKNPWLLIYYNGKDPGAGTWPMFGGDIEPLAPFYVFIEGDMSGYPESPKYGMISATQMSGIRAVNTENRYAPYFSPPMDPLSTIAQEGRSLFLQRCSTCHQGPGAVGGNVSQRPFIILKTHATYNPDHFKNVVADPKTLFPDTIMPRHSDFDDHHYEQLLAFLQETLKLENAQSAH